MSYNITGTELVCKASYITMAKLEELRATYGEDESLPEVNFLDPDWVKHQIVKDGKVYPKHIWWSGYGGSEGLLKKLLPAFTGDFDMILIWEGGDSVTGLRVKNGKVTKHEVGYSLGKQIK
jgi:hypothetical protein